MEWKGCHMGGYQGIYGRSTHVRNRSTGGKRTVSCLSAGKDSAGTSPGGPVQSMEQGMDRVRTLHVRRTNGKTGAVPTTTTGVLAGAKFRSVQGGHEPTSEHPTPYPKAGDWDHPGGTNRTSCGMGGRGRQGRHNRPRPTLPLAYNGLRLHRRNGGT